ncbi:hypothetical protein ACOME3_005127 [Neoechinorhynchus agilis]
MSSSQLKTVLGHEESFDSTSEPNETNIWTSILDNVKHSTRKDKKSSTVIMFGDEDSGRSTLINGWQEPENRSNVPQFGLEFHYIEVKDDDGEEVVSLSLWVMDGQGQCQLLLKDAIDSIDLDGTFMVFVVSLDKPWLLVNSLCRWLKVGQEMMENTNRLVIITKTDHSEYLRKEYGYTNEHFDFIQYNLRKICLKHKSGLAYTSTKNIQSMSRILRYMAHVSCGFSYEFKENVVDQDNIFIPIGWDDEEKLCMLKQTMTKFGPDEVDFESVIEKPTELSSVPSWQNRSTSTRIQSESEQRFLRRLHAQTNRLNFKSISEERKQTPSPQPPQQKSQKSSGQSKKRKENPELVQPSTNAPSRHTLATFFTNLLNNKQSSTDTVRNSAPGTQCPESEKEQARRPISEPVYTKVDDDDTAEK